MNPIKLTDCQVLSPSLNGRQELVIKIKCKKEDYSLQDYKNLCETCDTTQFVVLLQPFQEETVDRKPKLIQTLVMTVKEYCEVGRYEEEDEVARIKAKYFVNSRSEMTEAQLEDAIERYRIGIKSFL